MAEKTIEWQIADHIREIIRLIGEDPDREGLVKTPIRSAKALLYAVKGYGQTADDVVKNAVFSHDGSGMVMVKDIEFYSLCEHHILPFFGHVSIAYMPKGKVIGISKLARLTDMLAHRLQLQERLTLEIAKEVSRAVGSDDVMVACTAGHMCMKMRGVEKQDSMTVTVETLGAFAHDKSLQERFFNFCK
ncbi:MAG: GTP cyclohydrolase I FolE [Muribaculaceae bacterium]|nr:GTP cyclohydrolase I FolE [Muribaculaceae bacterium]